MARGKKRGGEGGEKEKRKKSKKRPRKWPTDFSTRAQAHPLPRYFFKFCRGKLEIRGSLTRGNRGKIDRLADTLRLEKETRGWEGMKKSCAIVRGRWRGTIDFFFVLFLWILIYCRSEKYWKGVRSSV